MARPSGSRTLRGLTLLLVVLLGTAALAVGVQQASAGLVSSGTRDTESPAAEATTPSTTSAAPSPAAAPTPKPSKAPTTPETPAAPKTSAPTSADPTPTATPAPEKAAPPAPLRRVLGPGDKGDEVRDVQARLKSLQWFSGDVTGSYGDTTAAAVRGFQDKRGFTVDGVVDTRTLRRIEQMSHTPTYGEMHNVVGFSGSTDRPLDKRCTTGRALCIDKTGRTVRWVVDGKVRSVMDVRFGASYSPTREGLFSVQSKSRDHVSRLYGSAMPFAMFFSGGQAVHYSSDFAARGYAGASHGCVNVRDRAGIEKLFDQVRVGDKVIVYRS
ncbi:hypothetical protein GCM10011519_26120 [Marmoricola endophyticus]|uniref:L,D-TPase catalytic domain-containing protein n=1 Tax=Marmoricola endophyticus TaxID=2040280 RepID=A0A917BLX4_9ACTN|nr:L,D-transpeptidase family protein [Marmoricola endophyticus]GGF50920.1 hypothetical protein GCM10011519_26120 [Marmoricola endophyticus]